MSLFVQNDPILRAEDKAAEFAKADDYARRIDTKQKRQVYQYMTPAHRGVIISLLERIEALESKVSRLEHAKLPPAL